MTKRLYPHVQAAFINAITEEGTHEDACKYLQEQWNEASYLRQALRQIVQFKPQLTPDDYGNKTNFATAIAIAEEAIKDV